MDKQGYVMFMDKGLGDVQLPNSDYQNIKKKFDRLCDEQEKIDNTGFGKVFECINETLLEGKPHPTLFPYTDDEQVIRKALELTGNSNDEGFCERFMRHYRLFVEGKKLQAKGLGLLAQHYAQNHQKEISVEGWRFVPFSIVGNPDIIKWVDEKIMNDAQEGKGLFTNHFQIPQEDELLDEFLGVEAYGLKCSFVPFLDELKRYGVVDGQEPFFSKELTRGLFAMLKQAANYLKEHTDKPQAIKNEIARLVNEFDNIPIWGIFFQILFLQGLCRLLEGVNINEGDDGYNEAYSLYEWLYMELAKKEIDFCYKPYGAKDREQLKPLCAYLMSTEVGQLVQSRLFGNEPEQANNGQTTDAQSLNPEPQQEQPEPEQTASTIPTINDTDKEKLVFGNALQKQYMSLKNGCYKWTLTKSLLAYMCGRLYCGDKIKEDSSDYSQKYIKGNTQMPAKEVKALFGVDVASNRYSIKAPPRNSWKVDELFKSNGASK